MAGYLSTFCLLLLWTTLATIDTRTSAQTTPKSHICDKERDEYFETVAPCSDFYKQAINSFFLDRKKSGLQHMSARAIQNKISQWMKYPGSSPTCHFFGKKKMKVKCCLGWNGTNCDKPICKPPCQNQGKCVGPNLCQCIDGYTGYLCEESTADVTDKLKYCYANPGCHGYKAEVGSQVMTLKQCCSSKGGSWGVVQKKGCLNCGKRDDQGGFPISTIEIDPNARFYTCMSYGPLYYRTFDGREYMFGGRCSYTLYHDTVRHVSVKNIDCDKTSTCRKELTIVLNENAKITALRSSIQVNDVNITVTEAKGYHNKAAGFTIQKSGDFYYAAYSTFGVKWDEENSWYITIDKSERGREKVIGMCGNYDGDPKNDMKKPNGAIVKDAATFGNAYKLDNNCPDAPGISFQCHSDRDMQIAATKCRRIKIDDAFIPCRMKENPKPFFARCMSEICGALSTLTGEALKKEIDYIVCNTFSAYGKLCSSKKVPVSWRKYNFCPRKCDADKIYTECGPKCPRTCHNWKFVMPSDCVDECVPGCVCKPGTFLHKHDQKCIPVHQCPCAFENKEYLTGQTMKIGCNRCECKRGFWNCTSDICEKTCSIVGKQHVTTFDGYEYDNIGSPCEYTLVERDPLMATDPRSELAISYKVKPCSDLGMSCTDGLSVTYRGTDIRIKRDGSAIIAGTLYDDLTNVPFSTNDIYVKQVTSLFVMIKVFGSRILYDVNGRIYITLEPFFRKKVRGLCGDNDGTGRHEYRTKNGLVGVAQHTFINSYQSQAKCEVVREKQYVDPCAFQSNTKGHEKACKYLTSGEVFGKCAVKMDMQLYEKWCTEDMCTDKNQESAAPVCIMAAHAAKECMARGIEVKWREKEPFASLCKDMPGYKCASHGGQHYRECASTCGACRDKQMEHLGCDDGCVAGCSCPSHQLQNEHGTCVALDECTCYDANDKTNPIKKAGETKKKKVPTATLR